MTDLAAVVFVLTGLGFGLWAGFRFAYRLGQYHERKRIMGILRREVN